MDNEKELNEQMDNLQEQRNRLIDNLEWAEHYLFEAITDAEDIDHEIPWYDETLDQLHYTLEDKQEEISEIIEELKERWGL